MLVYHEASPDKIESILQNGLKRQSRGAKGDDVWIKKTDKFLDERRPKKLRDAGVSRDDNIYAYLSTGEYIISITDGTLVPLTAFIKQASNGLLKLNINEANCFVSDLDTYDALKDALKNHSPRDTIEVLAQSYWHKLTLLSDYQNDDIRRPEIMITYNINPQFIKRAK